MGYAGRGHHAPVTHDAGLHLLEPLDRHGKLQLLVAVLRILQVINSVCVCVSVSLRFVVLSAGLCSLAHGGVCGAGASAGHCVRIVSPSSDVLYPSPDTPDVV